MGDVMLGNVRKTMRRRKMKNETTGAVRHGDDEERRMGREETAEKK